MDENVEKESKAREEADSDNLIAFMNANNDTKERSGDDYGDI